MTDFDHRPHLDPQSTGSSQARASAPVSPTAKVAGATAGGGKPRRRPRALPTVLAALACFAAAFEFLAFQLSSGHDPALGAGAMGGSAQAAKSSPVKKRIVITRVVPSTGTATSSSGAGYSPAAPAAAPAPAPVVTSSS